ncbi:putative membrane protein [Carnobacterium maltaromaticum LMA28]|uniref:Membrane protein n=2 Tax=Carnobacterium maltaromaticum TaxID=2751 RepID=K8EE95_CARML|nr:LytS/YhcK type 5TM receptor domain-containing protein [Carnobacterium maltaromaticum]CCO10103.1 putative membrane protein [Carnobacterium maltaromaticum LMA28]
MELLKIMEPYITGTTSILGIFFIQVMWITIFRVTLKEKMTEKKYHYLLELSSGIIMSIFSIYLLYMSQKENYYYLYSNLRLVIILLPTIFISARVSFISVFLAGVFSFFINGITLVSVAYIVTFSVFLLTVAITKKLVKGNQIKLFF